MTFQSVVVNGVIPVPVDADVPDGTPVRVETARGSLFSDLRDLAGNWSGDDADNVINEIYKARTSAGIRAALDE